MFRGIIRYIVLTLVVIGIVLLMGSLVNNGDASFNSSSKNSGTSVKYYTASIRVLDKESKKFLSGGSFILKNSEDEIVDEWNSTENIHRATRLKNGTYVIEQVSAADGYEVADNVTFKILSSDKDVVVYNEVSVEEQKITSNEVSVDNTLSVKSFLSYVVAIVIIGCGFILIVNKKIRV